MKVKNFGSTPTSIVVAGVRYQFAADAVLEFEDKNELLVDEAIKIYPDLKVIYENKEEEILTDDEIAQAIADHNSSPSAHSGAIAGAISDHVSESDPHAQYQKESEKDAPNGYAGLDGGGKVNISVLPSSIMRFKDFWNAATNTPTLADGIGTAGDVYEVPAGGAGTQDLGSGSQTFAEGDWIVYNGLGQWKKSLNSAAAIPDASEVVAGKVNISAQTFGGHKTFAGGLSTPVAPTSANHVANKAFVDSKVNANIKLITSGLWSWFVSSNSSIVDSDEGGAGNGNPFYKYTAIPFTLAQQTTLTQIELRLRQFLGATSLTVDVVPDVAGSPDETNILATSGLGNVTSSSFEWIPFSLPNTVLAAGTYWMVFTIPNGIAIEFSNANQAKISTDLGATWVLEPNNNVLFRVTGSTETSSLSLSQDAFIQVAGLPDASNKISPFTDSLANGEVLWVTLNKTNAPQTLTVNKSVITAVQNDPDKFILVRRIGTKVFVSDDFFVQSASVNEQGLVNISAQTFGGHKTFKDGLTSQEEVIISSTLNSYASVRTPNTNGDSQSLVIASGDSVTGSSADVVLASGDATKTAPNPLAIQGVTYTQKSSFYGLGKATHLVSVQIIVDDINITNPASPTFFLRGSSSQRLVVRVNSTTTIDQLIAAFPTSGAVFNAFTVAGSGATTFTNTTQFFTGAKDNGEAIVQSDYRSRIESNTLILGSTTAVNGSFGLNTPNASGADSSNTLFILTGQVDGTGTTGGISIRSADATGTGGTGGTFIRTGSVNGSVASGTTSISTGATTTYATANSGVLNLTSGNIAGLSGNSGSVNLNSGDVSTGVGSSGSVNIRTGNLIASTTANSGSLNISTGSINNTSSSGQSGNLSIFTGANAGSGQTGNLLVISSGKPNVIGVLGNSGTATFGSGQAVAGNSGAVFLTSGAITNSGVGVSGTVSVGSGSTITGASGAVFINSGNVTSGTANSGTINIITGTSAGGVRGGIILDGFAVYLRHANNQGLFAVNNSTGNTFGIFMQTQDNIVSGKNVHARLGMTNFMDKVHLGIEAGGDSVTVPYGGNLILAAGFAGQGTNNGGHLYLESGGSIGGNGGDIQLKINGIGTTVGKIKLDGVLKAFVRTGHTNLEDGDIWFDGTDLKMRIGGVTKTFTLV